MILSVKYWSICCQNLPGATPICGAAIGAPLDIDRRARWTIRVGALGNIARGLQKLRPMEFYLCRARVFARTQCAGEFWEGC